MTTLQEKNALTNYLKRKLEGLRPSEKTQITLIVLWLIEIYQNKVEILFYPIKNVFYCDH